MKKTIALIAVILGLLMVTPMVSAAEQTAGSTVSGDQMVLAGAGPFVDSPPTGINQFDEKFYRTFRDDWPGKIDNSKPDEVLVYNAQVNLIKAQMKAEGKSDAEISAEVGKIAAPPSAWGGGMPSTGLVYVPVFLVDFSDYPHYADQTPGEVYSGFNGPGYSSQGVYRSWRQYYRNSSFNMLNPYASVYGWYRAAHPRSYYTNNEQALVKEVLNAYNGGAYGNINFANFDRNSDGYLDGLFIKWTGPRGAWASSWWAWQSTGFDTTYSVDGKKIRKWVWSWYGGWGANVDHKYYPRVDIHESGHLLGLPDLYDYTPTTNPKGGVGGWDMMDGNTGDHNAFSKWMLGWGPGGAGSNINPAFVNSPANQGTFTLKPNWTAVVIMPTKWAAPMWDEFFMVEYRKAGVGNNPAGFGPGDALMIWHVDSRLNGAGNNFNFSNSDGLHKYMLLEQADGLGSIEQGTSSYDINDFYKAGQSFTQTTSPDSSSYYTYGSCNGQRGIGDMTGVSVTNIAHPTATTMTAKFNIIQPYAVDLTWSASNDLDLYSETPTLWQQTGGPALTTPAAAWYRIYYANKGSLNYMPMIKHHMDEYAGGAWYKNELTQGRGFFPEWTAFYVQKSSGAAMLNRTAATVKLYKNGVYTAQWTIPTTGTNSIGSRWWVCAVNGRTGQWGWWNQVLSTSATPAGSMAASTHTGAPAAAEVKDQTAAPVVMPPSKL